MLAVSNTPTHPSARTLAPTQASDATVTHITNTEEEEQILCKFLCQYDAETEWVHDEFLRLNRAEKQMSARSSPTANQALLHQAKNAAPSAKVNHRRLRQMLIKLGMAHVPDANMEVDESKPSGRDYSETEKGTCRRHGMGSESEELEESEDDKNGKASGERSGGGGKGGSKDDSESSEDSDFESSEDDGSESSEDDSSESSKDDGSESGEG